jgi:hypothetical protein
MRVILCLLWLLIAAQMQAQVFMRAFDNAAAAGMGGATIALPVFSAGIQNEAAVARAPKWGFLASAALPYNIEGWQSAQLQAYGKIDRRSGFGLDALINGTDAYQEQQFRLLYGRQLSAKFQIGASANLMRVSQQEYGQANALSFNIGMLAQALPNVWIGAQISNPFQQKLEEETLRSVLRIGACWKPGDQFLLSFETEKNIDRPAQIKGGFEYAPGNILVLRGGMRTQPARISLGAGLRLKKGLTLDAVSEWHPALGITPGFGLSWRKP